MAENRSQGNYEVWTIPPKGQNSKVGLYSVLLCRNHTEWAIWCSEKTEKWVFERKLWRAGSKVEKQPRAVKQNSTLPSFLLTTFHLFFFFLAYCLW